MKAENNFHKYYKAGVFLKGLNGLLEILGGTLLLIITDTELNTTIAILTQGELSRDPQDFIFRVLSRFAHDISSSAKLFGGIYLLSHGILKVGMAIGLLKNKMWAYPTSMIFLSLFVVYQLYRLSVGFSYGILILTSLDSLLIFLIYNEYKSALKNSNQVSS